MMFNMKDVGTVESIVNEDLFYALIFLPHDMNGTTVIFTCTVMIGVNSMYSTNVTTWMMVVTGRDALAD